MAEALAQELQTYRMNLDCLLGTDEGRFVLIHGDRVLGVFDNQIDAIRTGYQQLGNVPFLVKQVLKIEVPLGFVSNLLGV
jgi:hypothetical protein